LEQTFVMVKPDGVQRRLVGEIIKTFEEKGLKLVALKMLRFTPELAARHYAEHVGKPFYPGLESFITSGPVVAMVLEGKEAIGIVRSIMGATDPQKAAIGTIRERFGIDIGRNVIHGSDSPASAEREIGLFFKDEELIDYQLTLGEWIYE
jgi:nucleoside-diphosphate kinase